MGSHIIFYRRHSLWNGNVVTVVMYKNLGLSNTDVAFYTSWLYLPWVIKPIWSPFVDILKTKKWWTVLMQFTVAVTFAGIAFTLPFDFWIQGTLAFFWLAAFSSATHDIAADGFYLLGLGSNKQAFFCRNKKSELSVI